MNAQTRPDILFIVLDTVRADRLSCYGYPRQTSPHIDAFAESSVLFERAISPAQWTVPAHASLFTGEYPTTHMTIEIYDKHSKEQLTLAEVLHREGYQTVGFCNNVLLGVVENDLDRGFTEFYNYGGTLANRPAIGDSRPRRLGQVAQRMARVVRRVATPITDSLARNDLLLRIAFHPRVIPLWQGLMNSKGNTALSIRDMVGYLHTRRRKGAERPIFAFANLMETHLPYGPRPQFIRKFAPYYWQDREARSFMKSYNLEYYRWLVPLVEPFTELQDRVLNDLYDAEVAYEDYLLRHLFSYLEDPEVRDNTLVILIADHGEGLNHHGFVGHSLFAYDDLVRVPLIIRYPPLYPEAQRISMPISTRRVFHTVLEAAGIDAVYDMREERPEAPIDVQKFSLTRALDGLDPDGGKVFSEAYAPETLLTLMEHNDPEAIEMYRCRLLRRAAYQGDYKLITVDDKPDELFDVIRDPGELDNLTDSNSEVVRALGEALVDFRVQAEARHPGSQESSRLGVEQDKQLAERLRRLGYLE